MESKKDFLNRLIDNPSYSGDRPLRLFKYREFDKYTFEMLETKEIFLCVAEKLDDPSECVVSVDVEGYYDVVNDTLRRECVEAIMKMIQPYMSEDNYEIARNEMYRIMTPDFKMRNNFLLDYSSELQDMCRGVNIAPVINWLASIPKLLDERQFKSQIEGLLLKGINARKETGICSLAELGDIEDMWNNYAHNKSGYCIEYDMVDYEFNSSLFPVVYEDNKETNLVMQTVATFLGQMINKFSNNQIDSDRSQFLRLFLTKDTKWSYQKEWRVIGKANDKVKAPKIRRIIVGANASTENKEKLREFCNKNQIRLDYFN